MSRRAVPGARPVCASFLPWAGWCGPRAAAGCVRLAATARLRRGGPAMPAVQGGRSTSVRRVLDVPAAGPPAGPATAARGLPMTEQSPAASLARFFGAPLSETDPELAAAIRAELGRQQDGIELIASENIVSAAVLEAQGSVLTNKYAEGYPGRRYYGGCAHVDVAEQLAIDRAKQLFECGFANVQPHSGAQANAAVFMALLQPGDTFRGMSLAAGGHLTHGAAPTMSGKWFRPVQYGVRQEDGLPDYDQLERLARAEKPKLIIAGGSC